MLLHDLALIPRLPLPGAHNVKAPSSAYNGRSRTSYGHSRQVKPPDRAVRYRGISIATAVEEEAARAFIAGCYDYFRSSLPYGNPSVIAGSSMKLESLNKRAAPNLSGRQVSGRCLCGAVKLEIDFPAFWAWHDHSTASRPAHGAAYATYVGCWRKHARVAKGRRSIARFEDATTESTRSFCSRCGTPLLYERKRSPHLVNIPRALFTGRTGTEIGSIRLGVLIAPSSQSYMASQLCPMLSEYTL